MRISSSRPSFDKPFDFDLVNNARVIPMINATRFKLANRAMDRAGLVKPTYLNPRAIIEAILKNDPGATEVAAALQRHLQDMMPKSRRSEMAVMERREAVGYYFASRSCNFTNHASSLSRNLRASGVH